MNKHGQVLVTFVIMIPLIIILIAMLIELSAISYNKIHLNSLTKTIIASCIDNPSKNDIINLYNRNGIKDDIEVYLEDGIRVRFNHQIDSFLGKMIGKDKYELKIDIIGKKENDRVKYLKGDQNE